jgi:hypothetical protein
LYVEGYWDYPLRERGLLFAPVAIDSDLALRPDWFFRPRYVVDDDCLQGALFVNSDCGQYYFGDYFDAGYRRRGFLSWLDFRFGHYGYDPLFGYYRSYYGADSGWEVGLRDLYAGRFSGALARPPRTLIEQNTLVQNITNNNTTVNNVTNINNVTMLTPLSQLNPAIATLRPVTPQVQQAALTAAQHLRTVSGQRGNLETHLLATGTAPGKTTGARQVVKVNLPKTTVGGVPAVRNASPAPVPPTAKPQLSSGSQLKPPAAAVKPVSQRPVTQPASPKPATKPAAAPVRPVTQNRVTQPALAKSVTKPQTAPARPVAQPRVTQPVAPKPAAKPPAAPVRPAVQHRVTQPASPKPVTKPPAAPAKPVTQPRVTQPVAPKPAAKPPAAPVRPAVQHRVTQPASPKPAAKPPTAPVKPTTQRRVSQPSAPKPSAKPQAAPRPVARPQAAPRPVAKPQAAPAKQAARPPARPAQVRAQPPARPAPKQAASAGKPNG